MDQSAGVQALAADEWDLIGRITAEAFADDAVNLWAFNGPGAMQGVFTAMARHLYLPKGFGHKTADGKAGTLWLPPHVKKDYTLLGNARMAKPILQHGGLTGLYRSLQISGRLEAMTPKAPHYYLFSIAVHPSLQGKGMGGVLMREALKTVDEHHMPAYLENSKERNIAFYRQFGFEIMEQVVPGRGCPPMWLMWRHAR